MTSREPFDAYEVAPCAPLAVMQSDHTYGDDVERVTTAEQLEEYADYLIWTVYGHRVNEGVWAIGDFTTREAALDMAYALQATKKGVPVNDETP